MPPAQYGPSIDALARKWHDLAERRLSSYEELYRSGRWKHYYPTQEQFAARMLDVIAVTRVFGALSREAPAAPQSDLRPAA